jgi:branched-chain amino acid transport system substrate-binding protein
MNPAMRSGKQMMNVPAAGSSLINRRTITVAALALLAGCTVIPKPAPPPPPPPPVEAAPDANALPTDANRHRVALLVPMTGLNAAIGQSIANAATMALLDTNAQNIRITTYDTAAGAGLAANKAILDGNRLILGPLMADDVVAVASVVRPAQVPMITFSNDVGVADRDVFVLGQVPGQSVARVLGHAKAKGIRSVGAIIPAGAYGQRVSSALIATARSIGVTITAIETYDRGNTSVASAVRRIMAKGAPGALLIADGGRIAVQAAPMAAGTRLLGTELWSGDAAIVKSPAMRGGWFAAITDKRFGQFEKSYRTRFGTAPSRMGPLGYDAVLLTINVARGWKPGTLFPTAKLYGRDGFVGLDGVFRFEANGVAERAMEVREVGAGTFVTVSPAADKLAP